MCTGPAIANLTAETTTAENETKTATTNTAEVTRKRPTCRVQGAAIGMTSTATGVKYVLLLGSTPWYLQLQHD